MEGASYECMICMDLLIEPVTIQCGHTFCKLCLAGCITSLRKCPICRKPIYQLIDNISKNFLLESLIKEKYPERYNQRLKTLQPQLEKFNEDTVTINNSIPSLILPKKNFLFSFANCIGMEFHTIRILGNSFAAVCLLKSASYISTILF